MDHDELNLDVAIDPHQLDIEAVRQAETFCKWAERAIHAKAEVDRQQNRLEVLEARLQLRCRENPREFGIEKVTEAAINAAVKLNSKYQARYEDFLMARKEASLLQAAAVASMEQKKRMLEVLIQLHGQQYFAGPSTPRSLVGAWQEYQEGRGESLKAKEASGFRKRVRKDET